VAQKTAVATVSTTRSEDDLRPISMLSKMFNMRTVGLRELRHDLPRILRRVDRGEEIEVTNRRRVIARLVPSHRPAASAVAMPDFSERLRRIFPRGPLPSGGVQAVLAEERSRS
jgi:prevent-host-death family protein